MTGACDYAAPARAIYWGARQIMLEVGRLQPGDVVEYEIAKKGFTYALLTAGDDERFIPPMRGQFYDISPSGLPSLPCVRYTGIHADGERVAIPVLPRRMYLFHAI